MEKVIAKGFTELSENEMESVDGGIGFLAACAAVAAVGAAAGACYKAGTAVGKFVYNVCH